MTRAILAIGVNTYDHVTSLEGAEIDATRIYEAMMDSDIGSCDPDLSRLLLSPTAQDVRTAIQEILFSEHPVDEFTFFFAGHGDIKSTGFYLALRDSRLGRISSTAFSLSELFANLSEARPTQTNVILDACFSGGVAVDLSVLSRPETSGYVGSPAVTLLAMAARDQTAGEFPDGGIGANALLDCISGRALVREDVPVLDLFDVGQVVSERVRRQGSQNPVLSALNVHRRSVFCRNPNFQASARSALQKWEPRTFLDSVEPVLAAHARSPADLLADVERLFGPLALKAAAGRDPFLAVEIRAAGCVALLPYAAGPIVAEWIKAELEQISAACKAAVRLVVEAIRDERYALLRGSGGLANLFLLPVRLSKLLGWAGAAFHIDLLLGREASFPREDFATLMESLVQHYGVSMNAMSDAQAPGLALGLTAAERLGITDPSEIILSSVFNSLVDCGARIADTNLDPDRILNYLLSRMSGDYTDVTEHLAQPTELLTVLLLLSRLYGLQDIFNDALADIDHVTINAFVADDYQAFGSASIEDGENNAYMIGHGIWSVEDLLRHWPAHAFVPPISPVVGGTAIFAALLFPDRVPWFVFPSERLEVDLSPGDSTSNPDQKKNHNILQSLD